MACSRSDGSGERISSGPRLGRPDWRRVSTASLADDVKQASSCSIVRPGAPFVMALVLLLLYASKCCPYYSGRVWRPGSGDSGAGACPRQRGRVPNSSRATRTWTTQPWLRHRTLVSKWGSKSRSKWSDLVPRGVDDKACAKSLWVKILLASEWKRSPRSVLQMVARFGTPRPSLPK